VLIDPQVNSLPKQADFEALVPVLQELLGVTTILPHHEIFDALKVIELVLAPAVTTAPGGKVQL
jgi:hypothetical protein